MPKPLVNNKIVYTNIYGRVIQHEGFLDQGVQKGDSPTFASLRLTGDAYVEGNLYVQGNSTILDTNVIEFEDNIILLNRLETGSGVTLNQAGFEIERGVLENYRIVFNESDDTFRIGLVSNLRAVATRQDSPQANGIMTWNDTTKSIDSSNAIVIDTSFASTTNSESTTSGAIVVSGGISISKDTTLGGKLSIVGSNNNNKSTLYTDSTTNSLHISSPKDINLLPLQNVFIPFDKTLSFGNTQQNMWADSLTSDININGNGHLFFNLNSGKRIAVPNMVPITFSTINEKIYTDGSNNMVVTGRQDVHLVPGTNKKVLVPSDTPLAFGSSTQYISSNLNNDLAIAAANHITLTPGPFQDIRIPTNNNLKFGSSGTQRIFANSTNELNIQATNDINVSAGHVNIPSGIPVTFGGYTQFIKGTSSNLILSAASAVQITDAIVTISNTSNATCASNGSIYTMGGLGVTKDIHCNGKLVVGDTFNIDTANRSVSVVSSNESAFVVKNTQENTVLKVDTQNSKVIIECTSQASDTSSGALVVSGGVAVQKALFVGDTATFNNGVNLSNTKITNLQNPSSAQDAATKAYVDLVKQGLYVKDSVRVATITAGNITSDFQSGMTVDNYVLQTGDRLLIKNQTSGIENGLYIVQSTGAPVRTDDLQSASHASGIFVFVQTGDSNGSLGFVCNSDPGSDLVGTDPLNFTQFTGLGHIDAGDGLTKSFNRIDVNVDSSSIEIVSDTLRVKNTIAGTGLTGGSGSALQTLSDQSHVTKLGTIDTGTWNGSIVSVPYGGTGQSQFTQGHILMGNHGNALATDSKFYYDISNQRLGIGTNTPSHNVSIYQTSTASLYLNAPKSEIILAQSNVAKAGLIYTTDYDQHANGVYPNALLLGNFDTSGNSLIQLCTDNESRIIVNNIGNVGIATSNPMYTLDLHGTLCVTRETQVKSTTNASDVSNGSLVVSGGLAVAKNTYMGGNLTILDTTNSDHVSNGAVRVQGGVSIMCSNNANSSGGGGLTVAGGTYIGKDLRIEGSIQGTNSGSISYGYLQLHATEASLSMSSGSLTTEGGITVKCSTNATSTAGGGLYVAGGAYIGKDAYIGGNLNVSDALVYKGNGVFDTITNTSGSLSQWIYLGQLNNEPIGYCDIQLSNGIQQTNSNLYALKFIASINGTSASYSHQHTGNTTQLFNDEHVNCFVFNDTTDKLHLFVHVPPSSTTFLHAIGKLGSSIESVSEGFSSLPNGGTSGFTGSWTEVYSTNKESTLCTSIGDLIVEGATCKIRDNLPVVGYNNSGVSASRDVGTLYQRYQTTNDIGSGDVVNDVYVFEDTLPNQSTASPSQIKFSNLANSTDNYYTGWWIKISSGLNSNQVRQITGYNGAQRIAQLDSQWTNQNPVDGDTILFYNYNYVATYFDETSNKFKIGFSHVDTDNNVLVNNGDCDLQIKNLYVSDTTSSINVSTGSIHTLGGIAIQNTNNSYHATHGGALSVLGGASVRNRLYVGDNIAIGSTTFLPQESLHIYQSSANLRLENDTHAYIDFVKHGTNNRFGIISDNSDNTFSLTCSSSGASPLSAQKVLVVTSQGNVCINTSSSSSLLTMQSNSYISTDADNGYFGIVSAISSTGGGNIVMYGNGHSTYPGNVDISSGTGGSVSVSTNNQKRLEINGKGIVSILNTTPSYGSTSGALIVAGGLSCIGTENSLSTSNGGCLTVVGGTSIGKDVYIGGNLFLSGNVFGESIVTSPTVVFSNTQGCSITSYGNNSLIKLSNQGIFSFYVEVTPSASSQNCQFEFDVPNRTSSFVNRFDLVASCHGYTDDTQVTPLFNVMCVGSKSSQRALVKFQSASTSLHFLSIICRYTL